jgi:SAM-dependent methyltransferase
MENARSFSRRLRRSVNRTIDALKAARQRRRQRAALRRARSGFGAAEFVGPYERHFSAAGFYEEQWLWAHRAKISGVVLDMSTPKYWHEWIYHLPGVARVCISDLSGAQVEKYGFTSPVDIAGDFCADTPPVPPGSFDTILCLSILEHSTDPHRLVTNLCNALRPGGWLFINVPFAYPDGHYKPDYWRFGRDGLKFLVSNQPLTDVQQGQLCDVWGHVGPLLGLDPGDRYHHGLPVYNWLIGRRV